MRVKDLSSFDSTHPEASSGPLPEAPPEPLVEGFLPPITARTEVAPDHQTCDVETGDLLVIHVGDDAMEYYGFLLLETYGNKLIGINLHSHTYGSRELDSWIEWYEEYEAAGAFDDGTKRIYPGVAPVANESTTNTEPQ